MTQHDIIEKAMLTNPQKKWWYASDFQHGEYFVGYEASPRMSELKKMKPTLFLEERDGRFRILAINWDNEKLIKEEKERLGIIC